MIRGSHGTSAKHALEYQSSEFSSQAQNSWHSFALLHEAIGKVTSLQKFPSTSSHSQGISSAFTFGIYYRQQQRYKPVSSVDISGFDSEPTRRSKAGDLLGIFALEIQPPLILDAAARELEAKYYCLPLFEAPPILTRELQPGGHALATIMTNPRYAASTIGLAPSALPHTLRIPSASVCARSIVARRQRAPRSQNGGAIANDFPNFASTGDVEIVLAGRSGAERRYCLHRLILAQASGFFEASLSEEWASNGELGRIGEDSEGLGTRRGERASVGRVLYRYELDLERGGEDEIAMLVRKVRFLAFCQSSLQSSSLLKKPVHTTLFGGDNMGKLVRNKSTMSSGFFRSFSAIQSAINITSDTGTAEEDDVVRDHDNLFRIFYNRAPLLDSVNITEAYLQCKSLLALADMYDALEIVGPRIDHHLLQFQTRLWKQIAKYPPSYLKLGFLARSRVIFAEALVHVVGQWPGGAAQLRGLPTALTELIADKADELSELQARLEGRLFRLTLVTPRGERVTPLNCYADWTAIALFRHWLAENTTPAAAFAESPSKLLPVSAAAAAATSRHSTLPPPPPQAFPTGRAYRLLAAGGPAYLGHEELKRFLKTTRPEEYGRESLRRLERRMEELKRAARDVVAPLVRSRLELDGGRSGSGSAGALLGYLTCTRVGEEDFPW